jgi:6-phosphogluconolactonase
MRLWLGGYSPDMGGAATGVGVLLAGAADDALAGGPLGFLGDAATTAGSPSWLTYHPTLDVVYAALEGAGTVQAFRRTGEASLAPLGAPAEAGASVCHIAVAPDASSLVAGCWGDGRVVRMALDAAGRPSGPVIAAAAVDPHAAHRPDAAAGAGTHAGFDIDLAAAARALRAAAGEEYAHLVPDHDEPEPAALTPDGLEGEASRPSHAHQAVFLSGGLVATTDMGLDLVRFWRVKAAGLALVQEVVLPEGSGPRHTVWHPSGHLYVVTELSHEVFVLAPDVTGEWRLVGGAHLGAGILPTDTAAELAPSRDGHFLYAGVRGSDTIAVLRVRGTGERVEPLALVEAGVHWPRHHLVARDTLLVAGQLADEVVSLGIDLRTGVPGRVRHRTPAPAPTCLLPAR